MYKQPFVSCLESLSTPSCQFDIQPIDAKVSQEFDQRIRFDFEVWGEYDSEFTLKVLQVLNQNQLTLDSLKNKVKASINGKQQFASQLTVSTEFVVDEQEVEQELQALTVNKPITIMLLNQELDGDLSGYDLQEAI